MSTLVTRSRHLLWITLFLFFLVGAGAPCVAAPTSEDSAPAKGMPDEPAGGEKATPAAEGAEAGPTAVPTVDEKAAEEACKKAVAGLRSGDFSGLDALPEGDRKALLSGPTGANVLTCLAIAEGNKDRCDSLAEDAKKGCLDQWKLGSELKNVPKEQIKAYFVYKSCSFNTDAAKCNVLRDAVGSGSAEKCASLAEAPYRAFCSAVATGDATKCESMPQGAERAYCAAFSADDASRCPKDSSDCIAMARGFAALKKGGLEAFKDIDATIAAAVMGTKACEALLGELEESCGKEK